MTRNVFIGFGFGASYFLPDWPKKERRKELLPFSFRCPGFIMTLPLKVDYGMEQEGGMTREDPCRCEVWPLIAHLSRLLLLPSPWKRKVVSQTIPGNAEKLRPLARAYRLRYSSLASSSPISSTARIALSFFSHFSTFRLGSKSLGVSGSRVKDSIKSLSKGCSSSTATL